VADVERIDLRLPLEVLKQIDSIAALTYSTRPKVIRRALEKYLGAPPPHVVPAEDEPAPPVEAPVAVETPPPPPVEVVLPPTVVEPPPVVEPPEIVAEPPMPRDFTGEVRVAKDGVICLDDLADIYGFDLAEARGELDVGDDYAYHQATDTYWGSKFAVQCCLAVLMRSDDMEAIEAFDLWIEKTMG